MRCTILASILFVLPKSKNSAELVRGLPPLIPREERTETMNGLILFILGCFLGGFLGVTVMCLLQINRLNHYEMRDKKEVDVDEKGS